MHVKQPRHSASFELSAHCEAIGMRLVRSPVPGGPGRRDDRARPYLEVERGAPFCGNVACALHVRPSDAQVEGGGNWITLGDGRMFGRSRFGDTFLCDACGTCRGPVRLRRAADRN
jgi:hypothetical protein